MKVNIKQGLPSGRKIGKLQELFTGTTTAFKRKTNVMLDPWEYCVYE